MTQAQFTDPALTNNVIGMLGNERAKSLSRREWLHRLKGLGLAVEALLKQDAEKTANALNPQEEPPDAPNDTDSDPSRDGPG